jgi:hypothetical protein
VPNARKLALALVLSGCTVHHPAVISAPRIEGDAVILDEHVTVACRGRREAPRCELAARYRVTASDGEPVRLSVAHQRASPPELTRDSRPLSAWPSALDVRDDPVMQARAPAANASSVRFDAERQQVVSLRSTLRPEPDAPFLADIELAAPLARHPAMASWLGTLPCEFHDGGCAFAITYLVARRSDRPGRVNVGLDVDHPGEWSHSLRRTNEGEGRWVHQGEVSEPRDIESVDLSLSTGERHAWAGGPLLGLGYNVVGPSTFRWRAAYEAFAPEFVAHALALEGDFERTLAIVPSVEFVSPSVLFLPSFGAGVGVPLRIAPSTEAGVRLMASAQLRYLGLVLLFDAYPQNEEPVVLALLAQASL